MYAAGVRTFVEVGPGAVLTGLVRQILGGRPHLAVSLDRKRQGWARGVPRRARHPVGRRSPRCASRRSGRAIGPRSTPPRGSAPVTPSPSPGPTGQALPAAGGAAALPPPNPPRRRAGDSAGRDRRRHSRTPTAGHSDYRGRTGLGGRLPGAQRQTAEAHVAYQRSMARPTGLPAHRRGRPRRPGRNARRCRRAAGSIPISAAAPAPVRRTRRSRRHRPRPPRRSRHPQRRSLPSRAPRPAPGIGLGRRTGAGSGSGRQSTSAPCCSRSSPRRPATPPTC